MSTVETATVTVERDRSTVTTSPVGEVLIRLVMEYTGPESFALVRTVADAYGINADALESDINYWVQTDGDTYNYPSPYAAECAAWTVERTLEGI